MPHPQPKENGVLQPEKQELDAQILWILGRQNTVGIIAEENQVEIVDLKEAESNTQFEFQESSHRRSGLEIINS